jgi:putative membrane protein
MSSLVVQIATALPPLAESFDGHHAWGAGWWVLMAVGLVAFWAVVIAGGIWLIRELTSARRSDHGRSDEPAALAILDRRLAEGAISIEEYEERRRALLNAKGPGGDG